MFGTKQAQPARRLFTVHQQLLFAWIGVNMLVTAVTALVFYERQKAVLLDGLDERLRAVAHLAQATLPAGYHDRITGPGSVPDAEFQAIVDRYNRLCVELGLEYIWSLMLVDGRIVFTSSTSPDKVAENRRHAKFFEEHSNPELYTATFESMRTTYRSNHDKWGDIRVVLVPFADASGRRYLFGASVRLTQVEQRLCTLTGYSAALGLAVFVLSMGVGLWVSHRVVRPIHRLTEIIRAQAAGGGPSEAEERGSYEQVMLARHFNHLSRALREKIAQLEASRTDLLGQREAERLQSEVELVVSEERYRRLLNFAVDGILIGAHDGTIIEANECICGLLGMPRTEVIGKHISAMPFTAESLRRFPWRYDLLQRGETVVSERAIRRHDGSEVIIEMHTKMMPDGTYQSIYHEITKRKQAEAALLETRRLLDEAQAMAKLGAWKYDVATGRAFWTDEVYRIHGVEPTFSLDDLERLINFYAAESASLVKAALLRAVLEAEPFDLELELVRATGERIWVRVCGKPMRLDGRVVSVNGSIMDITERKGAQALLELWNATLEQRVTERTAEVERYTRQLQALTTRLASVEEAERKRIAHVLHEDVQQSLVAARMTLGVAREMTRNAAARSTLSRADSMLERSIRLTRSLVHDIAVPGVRERDLPFAISWLVQQMQEKFGLAVSVSSSGPLSGLDEGVFLCLYRAVQELLFNVAKHAQVKAAAVSLNCDPNGCVRVTVSDQGCGFAGETTDGVREDGSGFGLFSTREWIEGLGGRMTVKSVVGGGTRVEVTVPGQESRPSLGQPLTGC